MRIFLAILILFLSPFPMSGQTVINVDIAGQSYTNIDGSIVDLYSDIDISNCSSISFSVDYNFSLPWEGSGNMEISTDCTGCAGDPSDPQSTGCDGCWDFLWMQFSIGGSQVDEELIGESGTTDAEQFGTYTSPVFCTDGEEFASIEITNQNWASDETNNFSSVIILCWEGVPDIITNDPICGSDDLDLDGNVGNSSDVTDFLWTNDGTGQIDDDESEVTFATTPEDGEEYTLTTTDVNNCQSTEDVTVSITTVPDIFPAGPLQVCDLLNDDEELFDLTSLDDDISGGVGVVNWYEDMSGTIQISNPTSYLSDDNTVYAQVEENGCLSLIEPIDLELLDNPDPIATSNFTSFCIGDGEDLELDEVGDFGDDWEWSGPDGFQAFEQDPVVMINSTSQAGTYTVTVTDITGMCTATSDVTITVGNVPAAQADATATELCGGSTLDLLETGGDAVSWSWTGPAGFNSTLQNPSIPDVDSSNEGDYTVTVTDADGCTNSSTVAITIGSIVAGIGGGADLCPNECTDSSTDLFFTFSGGTEPYNIVVSVNSFTLPGFAVNFDETIRICHDESIVLPSVDLGADPVIISLPDSFLPLTMQLISVTDDAGCDAMIDAANNTINLDLLDTPAIVDPDPDPYCTDQTGLIDLTIMEDEITGGDGTLSVSWFSDENLMDPIGDPANYDINDGLTIYAVVDDGNCFSESVEIELSVFLTPVIAVTEDIVDCVAEYELPDPSDIASIENENNPVYFLDAALTDGPYSPGTFINPEGLTMLYLYDSNGPCDDVQAVNFQVTIPPMIINPGDQLGGCGSIVLPLPETEGEVISFEYNTEEDGSGNSYIDGDEIFVIDNINLLYLIVTGENNCIVTQEIEIILTTSIDYTADIPMLNCDQLILPDILPQTASVAFFTEQNGKGEMYTPGDTVFGSENMNVDFTFYMFDPDQDPICAPEVPVDFSIVQGPDLTVPGDTVACEFYILPPLIGTQSDSASYSLSMTTDPISVLNIGDTIFNDQLIYLVDTLNECSFLDSFMITVQSIPFTGNDTSIEICEGFDVFNFDMMDIIGDPDPNGHWAYPQVPDFNPNDSTDIDLSIIPSGSYEFTYAIEDSCGLQSSSIFLEVMPLPFSGNDSIFSLCPGNPPINFMELLGFPETGGHWVQVAGPKTVDLIDSTEVDFGTADPGSYAFTYTIDGILAGPYCNATASSLIIDIAEGPNAGQDINSSACSGEILDFSTLISPDADMGGMLEPDGFLLSGTSWNTTGASTNQSYFVDYIVESMAQGCPNDTAHIEIFLTEEISAGQPVLANQVCAGETIQLADYLDNESPGGVFTLASDHNNIIGPNWTADANTSFSYIVPGTAGCPSDSIDFEIVVNALPELTVMAQSNEICGLEDCLVIDFSSPQFVAADFILSDINTGESWNLFQAIDNNGQLRLCPDGSPGDMSLNSDTLYLGNNAAVYELIPTSLMDIITYCSKDNDIAQTEIFEVYPTYQMSFEETVCPGESVNINGTEYSSSTDLMLQTINGCDSVIQIVINNYPSETGLVQEIYCEGDVINILGTDFSTDTNMTMTFDNASVFGCDSIIDIDIQFESTVFGNYDDQLCPDEVVMIEGQQFDINNQSGDVLIENGSVNGCDSTVVVNLSFYQDAENNYSESLCEGESFDIGSDSYDMTNPNGTTVLPGVSVNGCDSIVYVDLVFNSATESFFDQVLCEEMDFIINGTTYNSTNPAGIETIAGGNSSGCDSLININLSYELPSAQYNLFSSCPGENTGSIIIESASGLDFPINVQLDGQSQGNYDMLPIELNLSPGNYDLQLANGSCVFQEMIELSIVDTSGIQLQSSASALNTYQLSISGNQTITSIDWYPDNILSCTDCTNPVAQISQNTTINATAEIGNNCLIELSIDLTYTPVVRYYIPNIFDINNPPNDVFYIQSNFNDVSVIEMKIYDRWGNLVHNVGNHPVNDPDYGWNGLVDNQPVQQGVYVYMVKLRTTEGEEEIMSGTLTLVR